MKPDILFLAQNRLEFTQRTFRYLLEHTDWDLAGRLIVYDDASELRARLWLQDACAESPIPVHFRTSERWWGSPVAIMVDYLERDPAPWFVKIDNDVAVPPGWLQALLSVVERNPSIDLLGFEAGMTLVPHYWPGCVSIEDRIPDWDGLPLFEPSSHIGGVGLMRSSIFTRKRGRPLKAAGRYYGFTEWQHINKPTRGWIKPDLAAPLLDRIPVEPFRSWSDRYNKIGWQRAWTPYDEFLSWSYEWVIEKEAECATA